MADDSVTLVFMRCRGSVGMPHSVIYTRLCLKLELPFSLSRLWEQFDKHSSVFLTKGLAAERKSPRTTVTVG